MSDPVSGLEAAFERTGDVGTTASDDLAAHVADGDPHPGYVLESVLATLVSKTILGTVGSDANSLSAGVTLFTAPFDPNFQTLAISPAEAEVAFIVPYAGTLKNLFVRTGPTAAVGGTTLTITVRKNGSDTTLTVTGSASANTSSSDTTHSVAVTQGDRITISVTAVGGTSSASVASVSMEYDAALQ